MGTSPASYQVFYKGIKIGFLESVDYAYGWTFCPNADGQQKAGIVVLRVRLDKISDVKAFIRSRLEEQA